MNVAIRVDASLLMGTGHVMRCLTLAESLKQQGAKVEFICRTHKGNLIKRIEQQGFQTHKLSQPKKVVELNTLTSTSEREKLYGTQWLGCTQQQDAEQCRPILDILKPDWLIVDHYATDQIWQVILKYNYKKLMVIDDLADRKHLCDLLLDQTYSRDREDYVDLVPQNCKMLLGTQYALLRPEFAQWRKYSLKRRANPELKQLLITMGGVDSENFTGQVLDALKACNLPKELEIFVVMGETAPNIYAIKSQAKAMPYKTNVKTNVANMAELMANADLAIGAAGTTTWERCCLGLPSITVQLAANQKDIINLLTKLKITLPVESKHIKGGIKEIENLPIAVLLALSRESTKIIDGGGVGRVIQSMQRQHK